MNRWSAFISAYFDGGLDADEFAELERSICTDSRDADNFARQLLLHRQLYEVLHEQQLVRRLSAANQALLAPGTGAASATPSTRLQRALVRRPGPILAGWTAAVVSVVIGLLWAGGFLQQPKPVEQLVRPVAKVAEQFEGHRIIDTQGEIGATLTGAIDCKWTQGTAAPRYGEHLPVGTELSLVAGLAQVTFESGAKLVLTGPCDFRIDNPSLGTINTGRLTAVVPRRARGFVVRTPSAEVVDLGTEFGISVDENGLSEVHVFKGEVVSRRFDPSCDLVQRDFHLYENQAAEFRPGQHHVREFEASDARFVREITPRLTEADLPAAPRQSRLALWYAADLLVKTDSAGRVVAWRDVLCGDNQTSDDALQANQWAQPVLVENAINGRPAVRFDGKSSFLVTTPMETTDDQTVAFLARPEDMPTRSNDVGYLLNYNGPPHRDMRNAESSVPGVLQISPVHQGDGTHLMTAFVYRGVSAGRTTAVRPVHPGEPVVVVYVYDAAKQRAALYLNGELQAESLAPFPAGVVSRKVLGRHAHKHVFFGGDIAEIMIYNAALEPPALNEVSNYLCAKYGVKPFHTDAAQ